MFKRDDIIWRRPKCAVKDCKHEAMIMFHDKMICGDCYIKAKNNIVAKEKQLAGLVFE